MKKLINNSIFSIALLAILIASGCNREPVVPPQPVIEQISIADLRGLFTGTEMVIDSNVYIQGIVTLTPELNNIPAFIGYIQDETGAITLTITGNNTLSVGSELKIYCDGLSLVEYRGLLQFGEVDLVTQSELININAGMPSPAIVTIADILAGNNIGEYVQVNGSQFVESGNFSGGKTLTDCINMVEVYTRAEATFSGSTLPAGNGAFKGVISVYDDAQLIISDPVDLIMEDERCGDSSSDYLNEKFESLADYSDVTGIAGWTNPLQAGTRKWIARTYSSNVYAQASAFGSGLTEMISWLITPAIDLTSSTSPVFSFDSKAGYDNGATLEVLISTDYDGSGSPWNFTWTDLNPVLDDGPAGGYSANFLSSGVIDLSAYKSNAYIAFKYTGSDPSTTTTWQIDNVLVTEEVK